MMRRFTAVLLLALAIPSLGACGEGSLTTARSADLAADASLTTLSISSGTLSPSFTGGTTAYTASVANATTTISFTPTATSSGSTTTVNGVLVANGTASGTYNLAVGTNTFTVFVTAANGTTVRSYSITVTRAAG